MQNTGTSFVRTKYALPNRRVAPGVAMERQKAATLDTA